MHFKSILWSLLKIKDLFGRPMVYIIPLCRDKIRGGIELRTLRFMIQTTLFSYLIIDCSIVVNERLFKQQLQSS